MAETQEKQGPKVTVHWLEQSRAQRILWLLEELNVPYELKVYKRGKDLPLAPKELRDIHPLGKSPVITVERKSGPPVVVAESAFIIEYISEHFGKHLIPAKYAEAGEAGLGDETAEWLRYRYFMHYSEGSLFLPLMIGLFLYQLQGPYVPFLLRPITKLMGRLGEARFFNQEIAKHWDFLEDSLSKSGDFFAGSNLTGADCIMIYPLQAALEARILNKTKYPKLAAWVARMEARDAYVKAVKVVEAKTSESFSLAPRMY